MSHRCPSNPIWNALGRNLIIMGILMALVVQTQTTVQAEIYQYRDENGVLHFTNVPTNSFATKHQYKPYGHKPKVTQVQTSPYDTLIQEASLQYGIRFSLLKAIVRAESDFNPRAVSSKGAVGLMQIMPQNFGMLNLKNPYDPRQNIMAGAKYFRSLLNRYNGQVKMALAAYNAGPTAVEHYRSIPPYPETKAYVAKVMRFYKAYK